MAAWKATVSASSWVRRTFSMGVRSPPPPSHHLLVTTKRVFMWAVGTCGLCGWTMSDTPEAQKRGSSSAPGICLRNSGANSPWTVEVWTPAFSNTRPCEQACHAAAAVSPSRLHGVRTKRAGSLSPRGAPAGSSASIRSKAAHSSSRRASNQRRARSLWVSRGSPAVIAPSDKSPLPCSARHKGGWCSATCRGMRRAANYTLPRGFTMIEVNATRDR